MKYVLHTLKGLASASLLISYSALAVQDDWGDRFVPPSARAIDKYGVNVITGQVDGTVNTVSIGQEMGLSHSVTMGANHYSMIGLYNYYDKFNGKTKYKNIKGPDDTTDITKLKYGLVLTGPLGSEKFNILDNGRVVDDRSGARLLNGYTYRSTGDARNILEESSDRDYLIWTKSDGAQLYYDRLNHAAGSKAYLDKIIFPNGLTYYIGGDGVTTNTGYEIKFLYEYDARGISAEKLAIKNALPQNTDTAPQISGPQATDVARRNPKHIVGINRAYEVCNTGNDRFGTCDLEFEWPTATFSWPGGMPQVMYLGKNVLSVTDASGATTEFHYESKDRCLTPIGTCVPGYEEGVWWVSRLTGIKSSGSSMVDREYEIINEHEALFGGLVWGFGSMDGRLKAAKGPDGSGTYVLSQDDGYGGIVNAGHQVTAFLSWDFPGSYTRITVGNQGEYNYEDSYRNFLKSFTPKVGAKKTYEYDDRGNLQYIRTPNATPSIEIYAEYPSSCSDTSERKRCNKPIATANAKGKRTEFEYHKESGKISKVTQPADRRGIRAQTRYYYDEKYAWFKNDSGVLKRASTPVWMLVKESYCKSSAASGDSCSANDEMITEYDYGAAAEANNLHIRGVKMTDVEKNDIRLTCYSYDRLGNRIEEIAAKAEKQSCSE